MPDHGTIVCNEDDKIDALGLNTRVYNALRRSKIDTLKKLQGCLEQDTLWQIRNLGEKGIMEIERKLANITIITSTASLQERTSVGFSAQSDIPILIDWGPPRLPIHEVVKWQQWLLHKQINAGVLHPDVMICGRTLSELALEKVIYGIELYSRLVKILNSPVSVSGELEILLSSMNVRHF